MSKSSKISLNTDETICLPPETFYSCNVEEDFDNETYFVKSKSVKTNDNKKETTKPRVNNSSLRFLLGKILKKCLIIKLKSTGQIIIKRFKKNEQNKTLFMILMKCLILNSILSNEILNVL